MGADDQETRPRNGGGTEAQQLRVGRNLKRLSQMTSHLVVEKDRGKGGNVRSFIQQT